MQTFLLYYIISGIICAIIIHLYYDKCSEEYPILKYINKDFAILLNFLLGFIQLPIIIFELLHRQYLYIRIFINETKIKYNEYKIKKWRKKHEADMQECLKLMEILRKIADEKSVK